MRNPNGFGSITKVKRKNLRNPWQVRITVKTTVDENGKKHQQKSYWVILRQKKKH